MPKRETETKPLFGRGRKGSHSIDHSLMGHNVHYMGKVWKVMSAHQPGPGLEPWLTLRRGLVEALAKPHEIDLAFD